MRAPPVRRTVANSALVVNRSPVATGMRTPRCPVRRDPLRHPPRHLLVYDGATGVLVAAIVSMFLGKDLKDDPEYQARLAAGQIPTPHAAADRPPLKPAARRV